MAKELSADRAHTLLADWIGSATAPDVTEPIPSAPLASWLLRANGSQHEIYLKTSPHDIAGWSRQNYDLRIFNIVDFGAVGDGVTDNRAAINAAIAAAQAAGGGTIYVPPGQFAVLKPNAGTQDLLSVSNVQNLTFLGDGKASQIRISGDQHATSTVLFRLHNFTKGIRFISLFMDSALATNVEATNQNHLIQPQGAIADPAGSGTQDCDVIGCYFGQAHGDQIRLAGDTGVPTNDTRVFYNSCDGHDPGTGLRGSRSIVSFQRGVTRVMIAYNFMTGVLNGQLIDFEPSGTAQITDIDIIGNQLDHNSQGSPAFTLGGTSGAAATRVIAGYNTIAHGGDIVGQLVDRHILIGNVLVLDSPTTAAGAISIQDSITNLALIANSFNVTDATLARIPVALIATTTDPLQMTVMDNVVRGASCGAVGNGAGFFDAQGGSQVVSSGNVWSGLISVNPTVALKYRSGALGATGHIAYSGELVVPDAGSAANAVSGIQVGASNADNLTDASVRSCYVRNPGTATVVEWVSSGGAVFAGWRYCADNLLIGGSTATMAPPTTNVGVTGSGNAGPGTQIAITATTPVANVSAPAGSMVTDQGGGVATTLFVKETGAGVSGGTGGWIGVGPHEIQFGVIDTGAALTALFLAPGSDLAVASATTIEPRMPRPAAIRNWRVHQVVGTGAGNITYTVRKNNVAQSGSIVIAFTTAVGGPTGGTTVVAGDALSVVLTKSQAPATNPKNVVFTIEVAG
jgi:hypothetical protein